MSQRQLVTFLLARRATVLRQRHGRVLPGTIVIILALASIGISFFLTIAFWSLMFLGLGLIVMVSVFIYTRDRRRLYENNPPYPGLEVRD